MLDIGICRDPLPGQPLGNALLSAWTYCQLYGRCVKAAFQILTLVCRLAGYYWGWKPCSSCHKFKDSVCESISQDAAKIGSAKRTDGMAKDLLLGCWRRSPGVKFDLHMLPACQFCMSHTMTDYDRSASTHRWLLDQLPIRLGSAIRRILFQLSLSHRSW